MLLICSVLWIAVYPFVVVLLTIALLVLLRITASDYPLISSNFSYFKNEIKNLTYTSSLLIVVLYICWVATILHIFAIFTIPSAFIKPNPNLGCTAK